jgi:LPS-assembly protein
MAALPTDPRRMRRVVLGKLRLITAGALLVLGTATICAPALAQSPAVKQQVQMPILAFPTAPQPRKPARPVQKGAAQEQMLVNAARIDYDYTNHRVSAAGNVQIYYKGSTLEGDKVVYDENTKRLRAEGNARLTDENGNVTHGDVMDLSDDYRDGFVDSLRIERIDRTSIAAARANRSGGNFTVFESGVYTACLPCRDNPKRPPLWQVKSARIIHDQTEKMIYFEDAKIEFFGTPLLYLPYFSTPDPTVKRKSGFLMPTFRTSSIFGAAAEIPYYWALAPNYDMTLSPMITTRQGPLIEGEFRQRLIDGSYAIRAAGIYQLDKSAFAVGAPGYRDFRGSIESSGLFALNDKWVWGWDAIALTDRSFLQDYRPRLSSYTQSFDSSKLGLPGYSDATSQLFLSGKGDRSYFDIRSIYYTGFSSADQQSQLPFIHPVIDHVYVFNRPVVGGELTLRTNLVSLSRANADFDPRTLAATTAGTCVGTPSADPRNNCLLRGIPGDYTRFSTEASWRRTITDSLGQQFTPFFSVRGDAATLNVRNQTLGIPGFSTADFIQTGDSNLVRGMPTAGIEYRYPFINVQSWGTQTFEPIAQVIARPNETRVGRFPNEDAQSFTFDDTNLFKVDKFSGWDRVEGGGRANIGAQYTAQFNQGGMFNALFGQSYQLYGKNSFAQRDLTNTGLNSGLDTDASDYVTRLSFQPNSTYKFSARARFDHETFQRQRLEIEATANYDRWTLGATYGIYAPQPLLGIPSERQGLLGSASYKLDANWVVYGSSLYDLDAQKFVQGGIGLGYIDDCFIISLNYLSSYSYDVPTTTTFPSLGPPPALSNPKRVDAVMLQIGLRTISEASLNTRLPAQSR